jgi:hypothetical protein
LYRESNEGGHVIEGPHIFACFVWDIDAEAAWIAGWGGSST